MTSQGALNVITVTTAVFVTILLFLALAFIFVVVWRRHDSPPPKVEFDPASEQLTEERAEKPITYESPSS
jgi:hypothetical protein